MTDGTQPIRAHVTGWGRYAPAGVLTNADLERMVDTSDEWIVSRTGIRERRVAAANETTASMAAVASLRAIRTADIDLFIPHQANVRIVEAVAKGLDLPMSKMYVNLDRYGNTSAASVPIALAEAVNEGRVQVGDNIVMVAFGAGFTSGAVTVEWTADPARGRAGEAAVDADDVHVRLPVDWDSVDPIPQALVELLARPGPVDVPLDDVVPGEPERAHSEVPG